MVARTARVSGGGSKTAKKSRIVYFDVLRAIAPLAIIAIHVLDPIYRQPEIDYYGADYFWAHAVLSCMRWAVPVFIMMSGAIFLNPDRKFDLKTHYRKYVLRILAAYIVWSVVYAIGLSLTMEGTGYEKQATFLEYVFGGHYYHLWYLIMLLGLYIMVPILRKITADRGLMKYFLFLGIIICFALPLVADYCRILMEASSHTNPYVMGSLRGVVSGISYLAEKLPLNYLIYFVLGHYLATEDFSIKKRYCFYMVGIGTLLVNILLSPVRGQLLGGALDSDVYSADLQNINFLSLALSVAVFVFMRYMLKDKRRIPKIVEFMAKHSFGVYLIHYAFISFVLYQFIYTGGLSVANMWYFVPLFTISIYMVSLIAVWVLSKIPLVRKVV